MFNIAFCDDNSEFLLLLENIVKKECERLVPGGRDVSVGPSFASGREVIDYMAGHHVDVLLLDIDMPGMSGFEVAKIICNEYKSTKIVFMSAHDNFVYSTFEFYPFAYIRKSHIEQEFPKVLSRIIDKLEEPERRISLSTGTGMKTVDVSSIVYVESRRNYYSVFLVHGLEYTCRGTLSDFCRSVEKFDFFRIHSAFLINLEYVDRMPEGGFVIVNDVKLPIAQKRMKDFKKTYMDYVRRYFGA